MQMKAMMICVIGSSSSGCSLFLHTKFNNSFVAMSSFDILALNFISVMLVTTIEVLDDDMSKIH